MKPAIPVITGIGIISPIGNDKASVISALRTGLSGIRPDSEYREMGLRSHVSGTIRLVQPLDTLIDRKWLRFMGFAAAYAYLAMEQALADAGITGHDLSIGQLGERAGVIAGSGGTSVSNYVVALDALRAKGVKQIGPYAVARTMNSTIAANLASAFQIKGPSYGLSSACATGTHCIGQAADLIRSR